MVNFWISALKEYNASHNNGWCVYKKGTSQYNDVIKIMNRMKQGKQQYKTKEDVKPVKKKEEVRKVSINDLIEEWDGVNLPILYYQYYNNIEEDIPILKKVNQLVQKGHVVVPSELLGIFSNKELINKLFEHYGSNKKAIDVIDEGLRYIISSINDEATFPEKDMDTYKGYLKHLKAVNARKLYSNLG